MIALNPDELAALDRDVDTAEAMIKQAKTMLRIAERILLDRQGQILRASARDACRIDVQRPTV